MNRKAVALLSGGLDSMLSVRLILDQGIPVVGLRFLTHFGCDPVTSGSCGHDVEPLVQRWGSLGFTVRMAHLGQDYIEMVRNPKYGRGKNMNPCVDCRIMMLEWAREAMEKEEAGFLVTGEVLNQRAMSQTRERFRQIDRATGLEGRVLRPLSARRLEPTLPEKEGVVDRERLLDFSGRVRTPQYALAAKFGITEIPQPAGGCLLTDPGYSARLMDLWDHDPRAGPSEINLLRVGRHFRTGPRCKIVVGRNEAENRTIEALREPEDALVFLRAHQGPMVLVRGPSGPEEVRLAASLAVRYGDVPGKAAAAVVVRRGETETAVTAEVAHEEDYLPLRVGVPKEKGKKAKPGVAP
jgi:tRNA U34 2-thiouridine synthase MnmA/TrmU